MTTSEAITFIQQHYKLIYADTRKSAYAQYSYINGLLNMAGLIGTIGPTVVSQMQQEVQNIYDAHVDTLK